MATNMSPRERRDAVQEGPKTGAESGAAYVQPAVDIVEDSRGITVFADLPGVNVQGLRVHVEGDTLFIEGTSNLALPEGTRPVYAEQRSLSFGRRFTLSGDLDAGAIDAKLANGVLTVRIPKTPAAQPRRIEVTAG